MPFISTFLLCLLSTFAWSQETLQSKSTSADNLSTNNGQQNTHKVAYIHIDDEINDLQFRYVKRVIDEIKKQDVDILITEISSFGGAVSSAWDISQELLSLEGVRTIAFTNGEAISAGAMIAYSHQEVYVTRNAIIGDIGVIFQKDGGIEYAPEKIETFVRNNLKKLAQTNGWNEALIQKMTDLRQDIYQVRIERDNPDSWTYVLSTKLDLFIADHPYIDKEDPTQVVKTEWQEGYLITLTSHDAVQYGMATAMVDSLADVYEKVGVTEDMIVNLEKNENENLAWELGGFAPLLAGLALMFIVFEMKTPGVGVFAILGGICGTAYLVCQYYMDMAGYMEIIIIVLGITFIFIDILTMIGGGILLAGGFIMVLVGLLLSFMGNATQFDFGHPQFSVDLSSAFWNVIISFSIIIAGSYLFIRFIDTVPFVRSSIVTAEISGHVGSNIGEHSHTELVGSSGIAHCDMNPNGTVLVDGRPYSATSRPPVHIDEGTAVLITEVRFGELIVKKKADTSAEKEPEEESTGETNVPA